MQEELNEKTVALVIKTTKMTGTVLKYAMRKFLEEQQKSKAKIQQKREERAEMKACMIPQGKQTMRELMNQDMELTNIEITDGNIKSFERVARKYEVDFSLKKSYASKPPKYVVFFKAQDVDVMTAAFKEYSAKELKKTKKPSVLKRLRKTQNVQKKQQRSREKTKQKGREPSR
jgi:hypothetical protein